MVTITCQVFRVNMATVYAVKPVLSGHSKRRPKLVFKTEGQKYCRMLQKSILQYFLPSFRYHLSLRTLFRFLAHLSRRLMGELIVYQSLRRPSSLRPSTISNIFSSETTGPIKFKLHMETP